MRNFKSNVTNHWANALKSNYVSSIVLVTRASIHALLIWYKASKNSLFSIILFGKGTLLGFGSQSTCNYIDFPAKKNLPFLPVSNAIKLLPWTSDCFVCFVDNEERMQSEKSAWAENKINCFFLLMNNLWLTFIDEQFESNISFALSAHEPNEALVAIEIICGIDFIDWLSKCINWFKWSIDWFIINYQWSPKLRS